MTKPSVVFASALVVSAFSVAISPAAGQEQTPPSSGFELEEIVVTAQRREESLDRTPVAIAVISGEDLARRAITSEADLQSATPGLTVRQTGNSNQLNYALRGQSVDAFTGSTPAVLPYVNEIQVSNNSSTGFYDMQSVQVLKGPQGTLFGRNSTGGAVLFTTAAPTDSFEGYANVRGGNYDRLGFEGAINLPVAGDKLALRLAGSYEDHDGYVKNLFDGSTLGDLDRKAGRASVLFKPTDAITNSLVLEYQRSSGTSVPSEIYSAYPLGSTNNGTPLTPTGAALYSPFLDIAVGFPGAWNAYLATHPGVDPLGLISAAEAQNARDPHTVSLDSSGAHKATNHFVSNVTTLQLTDTFQIKNLLGYARSESEDTVDYDGSAFTIENVAAEGASLETTQVSEELQFLGEAFSQQLTYVLGLYFADQKTDNDLRVDLVDVSPIIPASAVRIMTEQHNESYAGYGQGTFSLAKVTGIEGLGVTAGIRYTEDEVTLEQRPGSQYLNFPFPTADNNLTRSDSKLSYQFGIQEQLDEVLLYAVTRRSFRSGGFNAQTAPFPGTAEDGGAGFKPEVATDIEIGAKFIGAIAGVRTRTSIALYDSKIDNVQRSIYATQPITQTLSALTVNIPQAKVRGVEFDFQINPANWLNLGLSLAYTDAEFNKNQASLFGVVQNYGPYADTPKESGTVFVEVSAPMPGELGTLNLRADCYGQSHFYFGSLNDSSVPGTRISGYGLTNFRVGLDDILRSGLSVAAQVRNAFDRDYFVGGTPLGNVFSLNTAIPGNPRTYFLDVRYEF